MAYVTPFTRNRKLVEYSGGRSTDQNMVEPSSLVKYAETFWDRSSSRSAASCAMLGSSNGRGRGPIMAFRRRRSAIRAPFSCDLGFGKARKLAVMSWW